MGSRQPACDPCRKAKVACDHKRPTCTRCRKYERESLCNYRASPFAKRKREAASAQSTPTQTSSSVHQPRPSRTHIQRFQRSPRPPQQHPTHEDTHYNLYPNPGHQGASSHATIFNELRSVNAVLPNIDPAARASPPPIGSDSRTTRFNANYLVYQAAADLRKLLSLSSLTELRALVDFWRAKGANLALAEPLVQPCLDTVTDLQRTWAPQSFDPQELIERLLDNSRRPLQVSSSFTLQDFAAQICGTNVRLEALGLFLCASVGATIAVPLFPPLYSSDEARYTLRRLATRLCDAVVNLCLDLDCLNDLQLILQWEHFHVHSNVSGDQSRSRSPAS
jgi:hypothetical protein